MVYTHKNGTIYESRIGSRAKVWHGKAYMTSGRLKKEDLMKNKRGLIISKKRFENGKKALEGGFLVPRSAEYLKELRQRKEQRKGS